MYSASVGAMHTGSQNPVIIVHGSPPFSHAMIGSPA